MFLCGLESEWMFIFRVCLKEIVFLWRTCFQFILSCTMLFLKCAVSVLPYSLISCVPGCPSVCVCDEVWALGAL